MALWLRAWHVRNFASDGFALGCTRNLRSRDAQIAASHNCLRPIAHYSVASDVCSRSQLGFDESGIRVDSENIGETARVASLSRFENTLYTLKPGESPCRYSRLRSGNNFARLGWRNIPIALKTVVRHTRNMYREQRRTQGKILLIAGCAWFILTFFWLRL
jgi:hypothetical protein